MGKYEDASERTPGHSSNTFKNADVYVAESKLLKRLSTNSNMEYGLFTNRAYKKGDVVQEYKGEIKSDEEAEQKKCCKKYMFDVKYNGKVHHVIDAANKKNSSALRYINASLTMTAKNRNSEFKQYKLKVYLVAIKDIRKKTELLTYYGENTIGVLKER
jgi:SET domain-containing protein